ncbi:MAG: hypothetical protein RIC55_13160 [Pirellulaceae bacterium]
MMRQIRRLAAHRATSLDRRWRNAWGILCLLALLAAPGCAVDRRGQDTPPPAGQDNITYFGHDPKFQLSSEAAAQRDLVAEQQLRRPGQSASSCNCPGCR